MTPVDIKSLSIEQIEELKRMFCDPIQPPFTNGLIGDYVVVRCRDAGVHCGVLESHNGRECVLSNSRRLWKWIPAKGKWLSAVANHGLSADSKVSEPVRLIHLTENCEIIACTKNAETSLRAVESDE